MRQADSGRFEVAGFSEDERKGTLPPRNLTVCLDHWRHHRQGRCQHALVSEPWHQLRGQALIGVVLLDASPECVGFLRQRHAFVVATPQDCQRGLHSHHAEAMAGNANVGGECNQVGHLGIKQREVAGLKPRACPSDASDQLVLTILAVPGPLHHLDSGGHSLGQTAWAMLGPDAAFESEGNGCVVAQCAS